MSQGDLIVKMTINNLTCICVGTELCLTVNFTFRSLTLPLTISVPFSELVLPTTSGDGCAFALEPRPKNNKAPYRLNLGSPIVSSMYLIVDYDETAIQIARARYDGQEADIVPINHRLSNLV